ncbi:adenylosuccinate synthase [bacterium]|nr:adenylosuccinate synthase [bacterium]
MGVTVIVGAQWGDEGKGKITHLLSPKFDAVVRYQGGSNAGHTVKTRGSTYKFHLLPSGILHEGKKCILAAGVVIDPTTLAREITELTESGYFKGELIISSDAHIVAPYHKLLDEMEEKRLGKSAIGTTGHGIGPAYSDKYLRIGIKAGDLLDHDILRRKVEYAVETKNSLLTALYSHEPLDAGEQFEMMVESGKHIVPFIKNTIPIIRDLLANGSELLLEGAQGTLLDIDYGTYPFVTSSHPVTAGACLGTGISPLKLNRVIAVSKAYATRVGNGSFPTEQRNDLGDRMREAGREYGTTTGRKRRCGWLDLVLLKYAILINGATDIALTKIDVLNEFDSINVCVGYMYKGERIDEVDLDDSILSKCKPIYEEFPGWKEEIGYMRSPDELPEKLMSFIGFVEGKLGIPASILSVGPDHDQTIFRNGI